MAAAIQFAENLGNYTASQLNATTQWVVGYDAGQSPAALAAAVGATDGGSTGFITNTNLFTFPAALGWQAASTRLNNQNGIAFAYPLVKYQMAKHFTPDDTYFGEQWHLENTGQTGGLIGGDANVKGVWDNYLGDGVIIGIVDDSVQWRHPDLQGHYRSDLSKDFRDLDLDPSPVDVDDNHGTSVAGVAAGIGNNALGTTGSAPHAQFAGMRLIGGSISDLDIASALSFKNQDVDIYNNSWGNGNPGGLGGIGPLSVAALQDDFENGRGGLGNVVVFSAGNGQANLDDTNYSGFANSRFVIPVAALDHNGIQTVYSTPGASLLVSAYSNNLANVGITTTDRTGADGYNFDPTASDGDSFPDLDYTSTFGGTSSSAPLVSGVLALLLESNPNLSARDVQYLLVENSRMTDAADVSWAPNGDGKLVSDKYGYGAIDAQLLVDAGSHWSNVAPQVSYSTPVLAVNQGIPDNFQGGIQKTVFVSQDITLEWVEVKFNAAHSYRGDLKVELVSPDGTVSVLARDRIVDSGDNYVNWVFATARNWGESSQGTWTLRVSDRKPADGGSWGDWQLNFYGVDNEVPRTLNDSATTLEDTPVQIDILSNDFDPDGSLSTSTIGLAVPPQHGTVTFDSSTGVATYTPDLNYFGPDEFTYIVQDTEGGASRVTKVTLTVTPVNDPPLVQDDTVETPANQAVNIPILANDGDVDGTLDVLTVSIVTLPSHGSLTVSPTNGDVLYTPDSSFTDTDSFSYTVRDDLGEISNVGLVTINRRNESPTAADDTAFTNKNASISIDVLNNDSDPDGSLVASSVEITTAPGNGNAVVDTSNGHIIYTPSINYFGSDQLRYRVKDNDGALSAIVVVDITVDRNGTPIAISREFPVPRPFRNLDVITILDDPVGGQLTAELLTGTSHGSLSLTSQGSFSYTANGSFHGIDRFTFRVSDGVNVSAPASATIVSGDFVWGRKLINDLFRRNPSESEVESLVTRLDGGTSYSTIVSQFLASNDYFTSALSDIYQRLLGRPLDNGGAQFWINNLRAGGTLDGITAAIAASSEFFFKNGGSNSGFVTALYRDVLQRANPPSSGELNFWQSQLNGGMSRFTVASIFVGSDEFKRVKIRNWYLDYLGRQPDIPGLNFWLNRMRDGTPDSAVQLAILTSGEYVNS